MNLEAWTSQVREAFEAALPGARVVDVAPKGITGHLLQAGAITEADARSAGQALAHQAEDLGLSVFVALPKFMDRPCVVDGPVRAVKPRASKPGQATVLFAVQGWPE